VDTSDTRYAQSGDVHVAYRVFGEGAFDLVFARGLDFPSVECHLFRYAAARALRRTLDNLARQLAAPEATAER
jgi:hypothetical protein